MASFNTDRAVNSAIEEPGNANQSRQRTLFTAEDLFNYLYGYTPIHLVDPTQLYRERQRQLAAKSDNGAAKEGASWCDICCEKHNGECPMHGPLHSLRRLVNAGQSSSPLEKGSILKFPDEVCLCTSSIPCVGYGVCARKRIPAGTWIGPYEGKLVRPEDIKEGTETAYMWEVFHDGQVSHYLDGKEEHHSSWMRFVRCARHKKEQSMVVFQYHGCVYYRTVRDVLPGQELLVWYDSRYSQFMGIPVSLNDSGSRGVQPPRDLVAQEKSRARDKSESGEPMAKRPAYTDHQPAQRGRPPLRRVETKQTKVGHLDLAAFVEGRRSYRSRGFPGRPQSFRAGNRPDIAEESTWRCNQCLKAFTSREHLEVHQCNGGTEGKTLSCPHCNRTFSHHAEFRIHMESHINERPFRCGYCASAFASAAMLNQHVRVHMTEGHHVKLAPGQDRANREIPY